MKVLYRKSDGKIFGIGDNFGGIAAGYAQLEVSEANEAWETLAEIPDIEALSRADITARLDAKTGADIVAGMDYAGHHFRLTQEDQLNYSNLYVARALLTYPVTIKAAGMDFVELADAAAVEAFYLAGVSFVQNRLAGGWAEKSALETLTLSELIAYEVA